MFSTFEVKKENGMMIRGRFYEAKQEIKTLILCHGFTSSMLETSKYAEQLMQNGISTYIFDFCGGGYQTISDGDFHSYMTPLTEVDDLCTIVHYVLEKEKKRQVCVGGCSQGGFVSSLFASRNPSLVEKLVLLYPAFCIPDDARSGHMQNIVFDPGNIPDKVGVMPMQVSGNYPKSVIHMNIYDEIMKYNGPVLLLHGNKDAIVPVSYADKASQVLSNCEYHVIQGASHGFYEEPYLSEIITYIHTFLK